jgi:hypothetical protein
MMNNPFLQQIESPNYLAQKVAELHAELRCVDPLILAKRTGATWQPDGPQKGAFHLQYWGQDISLSYPEFESHYQDNDQELEAINQALLAYYFTLADGTPESGHWISFSELPDGTFYTRAFLGYTGNELKKTFVNDSQGYREVALSLGGRQLVGQTLLGDEAIGFSVLPRVSLLVVCWLGDEDFLPSYRILFDANVCHQLSTDACAVLGGELTRRLIRRYGQIKSLETV